MIRLYNLVCIAFFQVIAFLKKNSDIGLDFYFTKKNLILLFEKN